MRTRIRRRHIALNKPYGMLSQFSDIAASGHTTLASLGLPTRVYPVGRLDHDSEGLLILSDNPSIVHRLLEPTSRHPRTYLAQVEGIPDNNAVRHLSEGVLIRGARTSPSEISVLDHDPELPSRTVPIRFRKHVPTTWLRLTLTEGRNRQVRRMTAAVGHPTLRLVRIQIGGLCLADLELDPGMWRQISPAELALLLDPRWSTA